MGAIDVNTSIHDTSFVSFDFETTGIGDDDEIVEIGAVKFNTNKIIEEFSSLIKPTIAIPQEAINVHGITNEDVANAFSIEEILPHFMNVIRGSVLIAHNIVFDIRFLNNALQKSGEDQLLDIVFIDTLQCARKSKEAFSHYKLSSIAEYYGIDTKNSHRALDDALTCRSVFLRLIDEFSILGDMALLDMISS